MAGNKRKWLRPVLLVGLGAVLLAGGGGVGWWLGRDDAAAAETATVQTATETTTTVTVGTDTLTESVEATGTVTPAEQEAVSFSSTATVTSVDVAVGDAVTAGQVLGTIDTLDLRADVAAAQVTLASARAEVDAATTAVADAAETEDDEDATTTDDELAAAQLEKAQLTQQQAETTLASAQSLLDAATLTAPIDGVVTEVGVAVGDRATGSSSSGTGSTGSGAGQSPTGQSSTGSTSSTTAAFQIVGTKKWETTVSVDDTQVGLLKAGMQAQLTVDGATSQLFGKITEVGVVSTSTSDTAAYPVTVAITGDQPDLRDGTSATVTLIYSQLSDVVVVPTQAISTQDGASTVQKLVDGAEVATTVETGQTSGTMTQIVSGLAEGDQITMTSRVGGGRTQGTTDGAGGFQLPDGLELPDGVEFPIDGSFPGGGTGGFPGGGTGGGTGGGFSGGSGTRGGG